jgi:hypothetical protein
LEPVPGGDDVWSPSPAGWDLQDPAAGVGDVAGWGTEQPEPEGLGFGFGQVAVQGEMTQPPVQRRGEARELPARSCCGPSRWRGGSPQLRNG